MINWLLQPLQYAFMQRGMIAGILVGITCAVLGCYIVLKGMAFLGDALAHAILPGIAIAYLFNGNLIVGAMVAAIVVALGIGLFQRVARLKRILRLASCLQVRLPSVLLSSAAFVPMPST